MRMLNQWLLGAALLAPCLFLGPASTYADVPPTGTVPFGQGTDCNPTGLENECGQTVTPKKYVPPAPAPVKSKVVKPRKRVKRSYVAKPVKKAAPKKVVAKKRRVVAAKPKAPAAQAPVKNNIAPLKANPDPCLGLYQDVPYVEPPRLQ